MNPSPITDAEYRGLRADVSRWSDAVTEVLARHKISTPATPPTAGHNPTYPTFVLEDVVVKFFGHLADADASLRAERDTLALLASDPQISAPRLLGSGVLGERSGVSWSYLIQSRILGKPVWDVSLNRDQTLAVAAELGTQLRRVHSLPTTGIGTDAERPGIPLKEAAARSSLPDHLVSQVESFVAGASGTDRVLVHGDLVDNHVFIHGDRLAGIIDWGDALITDRYYELGKLFWGNFDGDEELLDEFLRAYGWPQDQDFAKNVLAFALKRQATGLAQHLGFDVFHKLPSELTSTRVATLEDLAARLFRKTP